MLFPRACKLGLDRNSESWTMELGARREWGVRSGGLDPPAGARPKKLQSAPGGDLIPGAVGISFFEVGGVAFVPRRLGRDKSGRGFFEQEVTELTETGKEMLSAVASVASCS